MAPRPDAVLLHLPREPLRQRLSAVRFIEATDESTLDAEDRASIRAVVTSGVQRLGPQQMDALPNLGLIVAIGAGIDGVDQAAAAARGVRIATGSGVNAEDVADAAVALFLTAARRIVSNDARVRTGGWLPRELQPVRSVGATAVGIVAMGHIGKAIAARLAPFRCRLAWTGPRPKPEVEIPYVPDLLELARQSDALIVAAPLNAETEGLISAEVIEALGPQGLLVNIARGGVADEDAVIAALKDGRLGGAALDVFQQEPTPPDRWRDVPNAVLSPHTAGVTHQAMAAVYDLAASRAIAYLREAPPRRSG
ncbi:NAD(P)-dependent oxidoreductase [Phenylobacterium sp.]|jgi:lactate dehydrogenase-like 2-hydroxyacid dehydrogenase|uniref:NAD(P)-dependent oxidoreductase n=1 Tax=Phenylobacterium sp. TaxID=1871053 RepID=UPI002F409E7C